MCMLVWMQTAEEAVGTSENRGARSHESSAVDDISTKNGEQAF